MKVRPARPEDAARWLAMRRALWPDAPEAELADEIDAFFGGNPPLVAVMICADDGDGPVGMLELALRSYAEGCSSAPVPFVEGWYVAPQARRRGAGRMLMAAAERWAVERGYREIASDTSLGNDLGEAAHRGLGFAEVERLVCFRKEVG